MSNTKPNTFNSPPITTAECPDWQCPSCTLLNPSVLLHCSMCTTSRPLPEYYDHINAPELLSATNSVTSPTPLPPTKSRGKKKNKWKKVSVQIEYSDDSNPHRTRYSSSLHSQSINGSTNLGPNVKNSSISDLRNYAFNDQYELDEEQESYMDIESVMVNSKISHSSTKNLKQLSNNSIYRNAGLGGLGDNRFQPTSPIRGAYTSRPHSRKSRRKKSRYSITDIFASNSSFILDHGYNEDDICNLILSNSTQSQTKIKFLQSIWPHVLRVTTRVINGSKFRCPICLDEEIVGGRITECGHCFCGSCLIHHLWSAINDKKHDNERRLVPKIEENYNFTDLFGHCPLCHEYVNFDQCRPLTVIRCPDFKVGDTIDMVLIERIRGEQPSFSPKLYGHQSISNSTFRKFETEQYEMEKTRDEISEIERAIKSADPIYEAPFMRLLTLQMQQYSAYISDQRDRYQIAPKTTPHSMYRTQSDQSQQYQQYQRFRSISKSKSLPMYSSGFGTSSDPQRAQQRAIQQELEQQRYRKKKFVYQSSDGQLIFLHQHNYNMLKYEVNHDFEAFPALLSQCKILEIERFEQSYDLRRKFPFLGFIPVDVSFMFVEVDLTDVVSAETTKHFEKQILHRARHRQEQKALMQKEMEHKKVLEEQRVALQKQKWMAPQVDIHDLIEFPSLGNDVNHHSDHSDQSRGKSKSPQEVNEKKTSPDLVPQRITTKQKSWSQMLTKAAPAEKPFVTPNRPTKVTVSQQTVPAENENENENENGNVIWDESGMWKVGGQIPDKRRRHRRRGNGRKKKKGSSKH